MSEEDLKSRARKTWGRTRSLGAEGEGHAGVERGPFLNRNLQRVVTQLALNPKRTRRTGGYLPPYLKNPPKTNASTEETGMNKIYERIAELMYEAKKGVFSQMGLPGGEQFETWLKQRPPPKPKPKPTKQKPKPQQKTLK